RAPSRDGGLPMTLRATWNGAVLAESDHVVTLERNSYFPPDSLRQEHFRPSRARSLCPWKGIASYYDVVVDDSVNTQAASYYPHPLRWAGRIKGRVAFWGGVRVEVVDERV